jgi:membrane protease YdiL (CAAX protease family)
VPTSSATVAQVPELPPERRADPDVPPPPPGAWPLADRTPPPTHVPPSQDDAAVRVPAGLGLSAAAIAVYLGGQLALQLLAGLVLVATGLLDPAVLDPSRLDPEDTGGGTALLTLVVASQLAGAAGVLLLLRRRGVPLRVLVGRVRPLGRHVGVGVGLGVVALVASTTVVAILVTLSGSEATPEQVLTGDLVGTPLQVLLTVLAAVVIAPLAEELLFRGLLHRSLRQRLSIVPATLLSSGLFALVHVDVALSQPLALVGLTVVGVVLALAHERTGSLVVPVVIHAVHNAITVVVVILVARLDIDLGRGLAVPGVVGRALAAVLG